MTTAISFITTLGVLIFVHELGHFLSAKFFRIKVLKFSIGFGPTLVSRVWGETEYLISAFPLGGYVKMLGEQPGESVAEEDNKHSFLLKPVWQRFIVVFCGPLFNLLFALFVFFSIYAAMGLPAPVVNTEIGAVTAGSPAEEAGLLVGDIILSVNGQGIQTWPELSEIISKSGGQQVQLTIQRNDDVIEITGMPKEQEVKNLFGEVVDSRFLLGITRSDEVIYQKVSLFRAFGAGLEQTWAFTSLTVLGIIKIFQNVIPASEIGGPILIANLAGQQFEAGWVNLFSFMALLSINLGIINLFPIPILDGGHLVFYSIEALRRKPLSLRSQEMLQQIGIVLLGSLMVFVFYNDLVKLFTKS